ncbi:hypothetical protein DERP_010918 [Dermatophagoides pteronyssinus]|uniref:Uncharacterized protein n=1 Tax=Dermatophagoides pteronyssinus TaxID=6956 RepID=A0ABQ8JUR4_DERPT|nr:hypothetical protein DERP_010918 [Dermatophagoides pteronyssinus]
MVTPPDKPSIFEKNFVVVLRFVYFSYIFSVLLTYIYGKHPKREKKRRKFGILFFNAPRYGTMRKELCSK